MNIHLGSEWLLLLLGMTAPLIIWGMVLLAGGIATLVRSKVRTKQ